MEINVITAYEKGSCVKLTRRPDLGVFTVTSVNILASENPKVMYTIRQTLWKAGAFGFEECFSLRVPENELELSENCPEVAEEALDLNIINTTL